MSSAGHPLPLLLGADGQVNRVGSHGQAIGIVELPELTDATFAPSPGDTIVLFTDGVTDARGRGETFGENRLRALLAMCAGMPPA